MPLLLAAVERYFYMEFYRQGFRAGLAARRNAARTPTDAYHHTILIYGTSSPESILEDERR